ncbi:MAG: hypothetical protein KJT01_13315 [Gemmatimonadetes bacterium]|nr:hypothetical protein [Gemmatimonadota bacterium]
MRPRIPSPVSLQREYELYIQRETEEYKESIPRSTLLKIGDEAVAVLQGQPQLGLTELLLTEEVDRLIGRRLRLPTYATWKRRRLKALAVYRTPEHWGIEPDAALVRELADGTDRHVLVAAVAQEGPALFLAARGCAVTALEPAADAVARMTRAAEVAGLAGRMRTHCQSLEGWSPDVALHAVVCTPAALAGLSATDRARVISVLQHATVDGGVHLVETLAAGVDAREGDGGGVPFDELASRYRGWNVSIERRSGRRDIFVARKGAAVA